MRRPWILIAWLWYVGTLVPVIGLVQVGSQSLADRYTYIPTIGRFVLIVWTVDDTTRGRAGLRRAAIGLAAAATRDRRCSRVWSHEAT